MQVTGGTLLSELYDPAPTSHGIVYERHRHRYEVNPAYVDRLKRAGLSVSGITPGMAGRGEGLVEAIEIASHPFFLGVQSHPEFRSRLMRPSPPFRGFIRAAAERAEQRTGSVPVATSASEDAP